jgi:hypothetical protein
MGYAKIVSGGEDGRYTIELDFGKAQRDAALAALGAFVSKIEIDIGVTLGKIATEEAKIVPLREAYTDAVNDYIEAAEYLRLNGHLPPGSPTLSTVAMDFAAAQIKRAEALLGPLRRRLDALKFLVRAAQLDVARWNSVDAISTRQAWCTTLTEDAAAGSYVATCDIPGDSNLVLIAPECRVPQNSDGYLRARAVMSPEQSFWVAAVQPGWQKWKPTYRWGTCTGINYDADTMDVALFDQKSDAQDLPVNQASTLTGVPVVYMTCNARAFEIDDRVVVEFQGQNWESPRVIGFLDNPKRCFGWQLFASNFVDFGPTLKLESYSSYFVEATKWAEWVDEAENGTLQMRIRMNGGSWVYFAEVDAIAGGFLVHSAPAPFTLALMNFLTVGSEMRVTASVDISPTGTQVGVPHTSDAIFEFLAQDLSGDVIYNCAFRVKADGTGNEFKQYKPLTPVLPGSYFAGPPSELSYTLYSDPP